MKVKLKHCDGCKGERVIWKNHGSNRYCKSCWTSINKTVTGNKNKPSTCKPIAHRSPKRAKQEREYLQKREKFLTEHPNCQVRLPGCTLAATDVHHTYAGSKRAEHFLDVPTWLSTCRICHMWIHEHPLEAKELGYLK